MKIVLAVDGSPCSDIAIGLVAGLTWPGGSTIRIVTALDTVRLVGPWATMTSYGLDDLEGSILQQLEGTLGAAAVRLADTGASVERRLLLGRPSAVIVEEARDMGADLIIMGSRGQGPIRTMLLGSVSAEVVDQAVCPVLVARSATVSRILVAHDGSESARAAEELVAGMAPFAGVPVDVLSVVLTHEAIAATLAPTTLQRSMAADRAIVEEARLHHDEIAAAAADRLGMSGRSARWSVRVGDPARLIVDESASRAVDLVVMGTHGRTGLGRIALGSVARNVLTHGHCSVLVVRAPRSVPSGHHDGANEPHAA